MINSTPPPTTTANTPKPVCPHCGVEYPDTWNIPNREIVELTCIDCKRAFVCTIKTTVSYTTRKKL